VTVTQRQTTGDMNPTTMALKPPTTPKEIKMIEKTLAEYETAIFTRLAKFGYSKDQADLDEIWDDWVDNIPSSLAVTRQIRHISSRQLNGKDE